MALHFHTLAIKNIARETEDCISISLEVPAELKETFQFIQGQSLTFKKVIDGEEIRRSYSICSSPLDDELMVAIKKVENGVFSSYAINDLKPGDLLDVMPPSGKFYTELQPEQQKNYMAFAAGSGITPILSIIKTTLAVETNSFFTLVYGNRLSGSIIFKEQLQALKDKYLQRFQLHHILSREILEAEIHAGRINKEKCSQLTKVIDYSKIDDFFLCGPEQMIFAVKDYLMEQKIDSSKIHFELFNTPLRKNPNLKETSFTSSKEESRITVKLDGRTFAFDLNYNSNNILDAALSAGADLPYACKGGVCCTCKARLLEGKVEMDVNYGLEPDEVAAGFILTCQSHPRTATVTVDFDER